MLDWQGQDDLNVHQWFWRPLLYQLSYDLTKCQGQESNLLATILAFLFTVLVTIATSHCLGCLAWVKRASFAHSPARSRQVGIEPTISLLTLLYHLSYLPIPSAIAQLCCQRHIPKSLWPDDGLVFR